ncbi:esterase [Actinomadura craniellae]|uniref:Esterase n=1 Tax=Actinomadura craniellae TaxID=2231787 RepID=A0A365H0D3_9ACTN|nr:serine hydrolase domain-containing protein [Actinomadura craniellae]RAY12531.1 esterase [Actinomadura craniellae]
MNIEGQCDPAFAAVRDAFERSFAAGRELGATVAVYAGDRKVVDLWGGVADRRTGREWRADTPCLTFSCTKAVTATAALLLAERGAYDVDGPVTKWWPEYGVAGKEETTAAHLLSHQAGLPAFDRTVAAEEAADPAARAAELAGQAPLWTPGAAHGYHAMTFGWLAGEIVRRHAGCTVGEFAGREFTGGLELWLGATDEVIGRSARLSAGRRPEGGGAGDVSAYLGSLMHRALDNPAPGRGGFNNPVVLRGGWPASGMVATGRGLAGFYRDLVAGRILRPETLADAIRPRAAGPDRVLLTESSFGLGYMRPASTFHLPRTAAFGHTGAGGAVGLGDVEAGIGLAYIPNLMGNRLAGDTRAYDLVEAVYASLS